MSLTSWKTTKTKKMIAHTIKALADIGSHTTIVIVGVADDIYALVGEHESVKRHIREIRMPRMSNEELNKILDDRLPAVGLKINEIARCKIIILSRGLPEYVHFLGRESALHAVKNHRSLIVEKDVDSAILDLLQKSDQSTSDDYRAATDSHRADNLYQQVILACALAKTDEEGNFVPRDVVLPLSRILRRSKKVTIATFQPHLTAFSKSERRHILEKRGRPRAFKYRFREPNMQPYVIMQGIAKGEVEENALNIFLQNPAQPRLSNEF